MNDETMCVPLDSVWGTFNYNADGYWIQVRNERINGDNCENIDRAEVTVQIGADALDTTIDGPRKNSCDTIRP